MAHRVPWMDPSQMPESTSGQQHREWPRSSPVPFNPHAFQLYQDPNSGHIAQNAPGAVSQALWAGSVGATLNHSEYPEAVVEHAHPGVDGEVAVEDELNNCDEVPCASISVSKKGSRKRGRDWTDEETWVLVECKRACFDDRGSRYRKEKSSATNWDAIAGALRERDPDSCGAWERDPDSCGAWERTGDQCRLRWDTLVKSHRLIKERCVESGKGYAEVIAEDRRSLKLATTLKREWYEVIDRVSGKARSRKQSNTGARKSKNGGGGDGPVRGGMGQAEAGPHAVLSEGVPGLGAGSIPGARGCPGMAKAKRKVVQRFQALDPRLRSTLVDLILCGVHCREVFVCVENSADQYKSLSRTCEWLSVVQSRSRSDVYDDVSMLMTMRLVKLDPHCSFNPCYGAETNGYHDEKEIEWSCFWVLEKFVNKLIEKNPSLDTHIFLNAPIRKRIIFKREPMTLNLVRVLTLSWCEELESIDLRGLLKLRSLTISGCPMLKEISGWKYLRELGWLEIVGCEAYVEYPKLEDLPSLRVCLIESSLDSVGYRFDISKCVRLRRLEIYDATLKESGDLSSLKCLEYLSFIRCGALSTINGLSGLHSLTRLMLCRCQSVCSLPDIGYMKELVHIDISYTKVEEIRGIEKLVCLRTLNCICSKLKCLPDLHGLPTLEKIFLRGTPLIEDDPSSFYFDREEVSFNCEETVLVEVSDINDDEDMSSESSNDEDE